MQISPGKSKHANERGAALIVVTIIVVLMGGMALAMMTESLAEHRVVDRQWAGLRAREIAEAGLAMAEVEIATQQDVDGDGVGSLTRPYAGGMLSVHAVPSPDATDRWTVTAVGEYQHVCRRLEVGVRTRTRQRHVEGLYSKETLRVDGNVKTDSYDSRLGSYGSQASNLDDNGDWCARAAGHVGSGQDIVMHGSSVSIRGNAIPGKDYTLQNNWGALITGDRLPRQHPVQISDPALPEFEAAFLSHENANLGATEALGADETNMAAVTDGELAALTHTQVSGLSKVDMMLLGDDEVGALRYADLLEPEYGTLLDVAPSTLEMSVDESYKYYRFAQEELYPSGIALDDSGDDGSDDDLLDDTTSTEGTDSTAPGTDSGAPGTSLYPPPGRVSYDPVTHDLRASAGAAVVLDGGTYAFSNIRLVGGAYLCVRGPSTIYVTGRVDLSGGAILNETGRPEDLRIIVHPYALPTAAPPSKSYVKIRGGSVVAASLYAPGVDISIGGTGHYYGSIVGKSISLQGDVSYHYDEALAAQTASGANVERLYWRELAPHMR